MPNPMEEITGARGLARPSRLMRKRACNNAIDWICRRCGGTNPTFRRQCKGCGARRPLPIKA